jgi:hypothetical protein
MLNAVMSAPAAGFLKSVVDSGVRVIWTGRHERLYTVCNF